MLLVCRKPCLFTVCLLLSLTSTYQPLVAQVSCVPAYVHEYIGQGNLESQAIKALPDGNFLVAGRGTPNTTSTDYDGLVMETSGTGTVLWSFFIGGSGNDVFSGITPLSDGSFMLYGTTASTGYSAGKAWLVHIGSTGSLLWSRQLGGIGAEPDRMKALLQFSDGDIVGTLNVSDSSALSDAVVFKMGLDGTLRWAHIFDNGDDDSFTSLAYSGTVIYAGGYYTATSKRGVICRINAVDGSFLDAQNIYLNDPGDHEEIKGLEVYNNIISYGLWISKPSPFPNGSPIVSILLVQTDMTGKNLFNILYTDDEGQGYIVPHRTPDGGFMALCTSLGQGTEPYVTRFNRTGMADWLLSFNYYKPTWLAVDITADGGCVTAGSYANFLTAQNRSILNITRTNSVGATGGCIYLRDARNYDTLSEKAQPFVWATQNAYFPSLSGFITDGESGFTSTMNNVCGPSFCTDNTPLPVTCMKTYRIEYTGDKSTLLRDMVSLSDPDGGRMAVGDCYNDGLLMKYGPNGDILWSKTFEEFNHTLRFMRIIRTPDNNLLIFGYNTWVAGSYAYVQSTLIKVDNNGNILWSKDLYNDGQVRDVCVTPDGGFVVVLDTYVNAPENDTYVARYDANANMVWQKDLTHPVHTPFYRTITCAGNAVFLGYDDIYSASTFGVDKLDLQTGNRIWSQRFLFGNNTDYILMNRIASIDDTCYVFYNKRTTLANYSVDQHICLTKLDPSGNAIQTVILQGDNILSTPTNGLFFDYNPPTVAMTPFFDFVLTSRVLVGTDSMLNVSHIQKDGTVIWSRNFTSLQGYQPYNIHPQATGFWVTGALTGPRADYVSFTNAFLIKADSNGQILSGAPADCSQTDRPLTLVPASVSVLSPAIDAVIPYNGETTSASSVTSFNIPMDATLYCNATMDCNEVGFLEKGTGCSLSDTLIYYLKDAANCDAAATWQFDATLFRPAFINGDTLKLLPLQKGGSTVTATIEGDCRLSVKNIVAPSLLSANDLHLGPDTVICDGASIKESAGPGYVSYLWNDNSTDSTLTVTNPGKYYVQVQDNCGGTSTDTVLVTSADMYFHVAGDSVSCNQDIIKLVATPGYSNYQWTPSPDGGVDGDTAFVSPASSTTYSVTAEKNPNCTVTASRPVTALSSPKVMLGGDTTVCQGDSVLLDAGVGFDRYRWNNGDTTIQIEAKTAGLYAIAALYSNGCISRDSFQLKTWAAPAPELNKGEAVCKGMVRILDAGDGYQQYLWSTGAVTQTLSVKDTGFYWVRVEDINGCYGADTIYFSGRECMLGLYVPNAFTPDGAANRTFRPLLYQPTVSYTFAVFNRWGQKMFESSVPLQGWDGQTNGSTPAPSGTYVWYCRYKTTGHPEQSATGTVELLR